MIDPTSFISELERSQEKSTGLLRNTGNVLAALALLWILFIALLVTNEYQRYLLKFPDDINQAFLTLWLTNFHGTDWSTFGLAVSGEIVLLVAYLGAILWIQKVKRSSEHRRNDLAVEIQRVTNDLIEEIARIAYMTAPSTERQLLDETRRLFADLSRFSQDSVANNEQVNGKFIEETKAIFQNLDTLSQKLLVAGNQINTNTQQLAGGTYNLTKSTEDAARSNLSLTSQLQKVEELQGQSAEETGNASQRMAEVAADMQKVVAHIESISQQLTTLSPQDIRLMADQTGTLASTFNRVNATLQATLEELRNTVQATTSAETANQNQFQNSFDNTSSQSRALDPEHLRFTAYYSKVVSLDRPQPLLVYSYIDSALQIVTADIAQYRQQVRQFSKGLCCKKKADLSK